jgi:hypothetical protein
MTKSDFEPYLATIKHYLGYYIHRDQYLDPPSPLENIRTDIMLDLDNLNQSVRAGTVTYFDFF